MLEYATARRNMVESQIRTNKVTDAGLIEAFERVPRELFVPERLRGIAYVDEDIALGNGRFAMEPMVLARLLQAARPEPDDIALDLGCATGYATAILSRLVATVVALEGEADLAAEANRILSELEIDNAVVGPAYRGLSQAGALQRHRPGRRRGRDPAGDRRPVGRRRAPGGGRQRGRGHGARHPHAT